MLQFYRGLIVLGLCVGATGCTSWDCSGECHSPGGQITYKAGSTSTFGDDQSAAVTQYWQANKDLCPSPGSQFQNVQCSHAAREEMSLIPEVDSNSSR